jgi:hypothetical protein
LAGPRHHQSAAGELTAFITKFKAHVLDTDDNGLPT